MDDPAKLAGGKLSEYAYRDQEHAGGRYEARSATDVLKDIIGNIQEIIRSEVRLARAEIREETGKLLNASRMLAIGAFAGIYAVGFILLSLVYGLASVVAPWLAALIVGVLLAIVAGVMVMSGRGRLKDVTPKPEKTIDTMKENIEWMKGQTRS